MNNLLIKLDKSYTYSIELRTSQDGQLRAKELIDISRIFRELGKSKNINTIVGAERLVLRHEREFYGTINKDAKPSLETAIKELDSAFKAYDIVLDKEKYKAVESAYPIKDKDRKNGLPKDAFHSFIDSHKTRLGNRIRSIEASFEEGLILKERYNNMKVAQQEYMKLQSQALNIPLPEKSKDLER